MKKVLVLLALSLSVMVSAQEKLTEGVVTSKQTISSDNEQMKAQLEMIGEIITTTYFKNEKSRSEVSNPMSGDVITITDSKDFLMLMDNPMLGKKYMLQNIEEANAQVESVEVVAGDETKTILGYECKQYTVTIKQAAGNMEMEMFTTESLSVQSQQLSVMGDKLKGFPLYMITSMNQGGMDMTITTEVTEIKKEEILDDKFSMVPPLGYEKMDGQ